MTYKALSQEELSRILGQRASFDRKEDNWITGRRIEAPLILNRTINPNPQIVIQQVIFKGCTFANEVFVGDNLQAGPITFIDCIFESTLQFTQFFNGHISGKTQCKGKVDINTDEGECTINNFNFEDECKIKGHGRILKISDANTFLTGGEKPGLNIRSTFHKIEIINTTTHSLEIDEMMDDKARSLSVTASNIQTIQLSRADRLLSTKVNNSKINEIVFASGGSNNYKLSINENSVVETISISLKNMSDIEIKDSTINTLSLSGVNGKEGFVQLTKTEIGTLKFDSVRNDGLISLREIIIPAQGKIIIESSNLGKTDFINCDFSKAHLEFENSKITEVFFSETEFPKRVRRNNQTNYPQAQLAFGQLATAFQKQGDTVRALEYQAREIGAHYKHVRLFSLDFFKKINLFLNLISNNFGRNWVLGMIFSAASGFLLFSALLISTKQYAWGFNIQWKELPAFIKFMNPLRFYDLDKLFETPDTNRIINFTPASYLVDFAGRILVAYGYYQTIQAFRRFGRK